MPLHQIKSGIIVPRFGTGLQPMGAGFVRAGAAAAGGFEFDYIGEVSSASDLTEYTFSNAALGPANADRRIYLAIHAGDTVPIAALSSCTIGGVSATIHVQIDMDISPSRLTAIASAAVPTGTTGDIVVTFADTIVRCVVEVYRAVGADATLADVDSSGAALGGDIGSDSPTLTLDTVAGGVVLAAATSNKTATSPIFTWTGITEKYDAELEIQSFDFSGGFNDSVSTGTLAVSFVTASGGNSGSAFAAVSIQPTA